MNFLGRKHRKVFIHDPKSFHKFYPLHLELLKLFQKKHSGVHSIPVAHKIIFTRWDGFFFFFFLVCLFVFQKASVLDSKKLKDKPQHDCFLLRTIRPS